MATDLGEIDANALTMPDLWDFILVAGRRSPGLAEVSGAERTYDWDKKKGGGTEGATLTYRGKDPVTPTIKLTFWTAQQLDEWESFRALLKYDGSKGKVQPVDIVHPAFAQNEIHSVVTKKIGQLTHEGLGRFSVTIEFIEYFPPKKTNATKTPTGSKQASGGTSDYAAKFWKDFNLGGETHQAVFSQPTAKETQTADRAKLLETLAKL